MMKSSLLGEIDVDLNSKDPWAPLYKYKKESLAIVKAFKEDAEDIVGKLAYATIGLALRGLEKVFYQKDPLFRNEIKSAARAIGCSETDLFLANLAYELDMAGQGLCGCTSCVYDIGGTSYHARNLDWELPVLRNKTIIVNFKYGHVRFKSITFPGYIGIMSGMNDSFSITINQAPLDNFPNVKGWSIGMFVRDIFENCFSFAEAYSVALSPSVIYPAFLHIVGADGDRRVVRVDPLKSCTESWKLPCITNHHPDDEDADEDSVERMETALKQHPKSIEECLKAIRTTAWKDTVQSMVMCPKTQQVLIY